MNKTSSRPFRPFSLFSLTLALVACGQPAKPPATVSSSAQPGVGIKALDLGSGVTYTLRSACSNKVLDVAGVSKNDGAVVQLWRGWNGPNQQWRVNRQGDGSYQLLSVGSAKALDVLGWGTGNGAAVAQWSWDGGANQRWRLTELGGGYVKLNPLHAPSKALDVAGASVKDGARVQLFSDNGTCAQRWKFEAVGATPAPPTPPADDRTGPKAWRAADFLDTIGVGAHFERIWDNNTIWAKQQNGLRQKLLDSGIAHVRIAHINGMEKGDRYMKYIQTMNGLKFDLQTSWDHDPATIPTINSLLNGNVDAIEAVNEPDNQGWSKSVWPKQLIANQRALRQVRDNNPSMKNVALYGPSVLTDDGAQAVADVGGVAGNFDCLNAHMYSTDAGPEELLSDAGLDGRGYGNVKYHKTRLGKMGDPTNCIVSTEAGGQDDPAFGGTPEKQTGRYAPRIYLEFAKKGVTRTYIYELVDEPGMGGGEEHFGLLRADLSEKPAFKAVKNMIALLKDAAGANTTFAPGQLNYSLSGRTDSVHQMLFQKANGTFYLALWIGKRSVKWPELTEISVPDQSVTLSVPTRTTATLHTLNDAGAMTDGSPQTIAGGKLSLSVSDRVTFVELK